MLKAYRRRPSCIGPNLHSHFHRRSVASSRLFSSPPHMPRRWPTTPNLVFGVIATTCGGIFLVTHDALNGAAERTKRAPPRPQYSTQDGRLHIELPPPDSDGAPARPSAADRADPTAAPGLVRTIRRSVTPDFVRDNLVLTPRNVDAGRWWTLLTPTLAHSTPLHLACNLFVTYGFGRSFVALYGPWRFAGVWVGGGLACAAASLWSETRRRRRDGARYVERGSLGASGSLTAMTTALILLRPYAQVTIMPFVSSSLATTMRSIQVADVSDCSLCPCMPGERYRYSVHLAPSVRLRELFQA